MELMTIWEMIIASAIGLFLLSGVLIVTNPELIKAKTFSNELSYISSLKTNDNTQITITAPKEFNVKNNDNTIIIENKKDSETLIEKKYLGNAKITQNEDLIIIS